MHLERLWLADFRNYADAELAPAPTGITLITGPNGSGKTNILEAIAYLSTLRSFRAAPAPALVREGCESAVVRASVVDPPRRVTIDAEIYPGGRDRVRISGQPLRRRHDLRSVFRVTVFSPDDLALVKAGPAERRAYLDDLLAACRPRLQALLSEVEGVTRQRNALLKSLAGRSPSSDALFTLDVWDSKLAAAGSELAEARRRLCSDLSPLVASAYEDLAGSSETALRYRSSWEGTLAEALAATRGEDLRRGVTTVGPHRDEVDLAIDGLPARTHASQGEQRSLALALRLAAHQLVRAAWDTVPVLLLDDVFSELDAKRSGALVRALGDHQALLTSAGSPPSGVEVAARFAVAEGKILR